ncbi:uncharacterized protein DS421_13g424230 [Arachis hypogaea]|nr:uncharacterized protein DS421_13g424230 [Arachis hypogaea]
MPPMREQVTLLRDVTHSFLFFFPFPTVSFHCCQTILALYLLLPFELSGLHWSASCNRLPFNFPATPLQAISLVWRNFPFRDPPIDRYDWVVSDVKSTPSQMTLEELTDFRLRDQLCGGGDEEGRYEVFVPADHERLCQLNLNTPRIADWLWVYKAMFTVLGVHLPFSPFQMALLNRCDVTPSQLYPNSWATIRHKKGFMSFRTAQGRRIFGTFEDSFHGFKDKFFKVRPAEGVHLFWLTLEGERQIPTYWSFGAGSNAFTKITYKGLTWRDKNIADVLLTIFNKNNINPHLLMGDWEMGRGYIVDMAAGHTGLEDLMSQFLPSHSEDSSATPSAEQPSSPTAEAESASPPPKSAGAIVTTSQSSSAVVPPEVEPANEGPNVVLMPGTEEFFHDGNLGAQARWIYRCMLRAAIIARRAEPILTQAGALDGRYRQSLREVEQLKSEVGILKQKLADSEGKLKTSDEAVARLTKREMKLESELNSARGETSAAQTKITTLEAKLEEAAKSIKSARDEVAGLKGKVAGLEKKNKDTVKKAREVINGTEEAIKAHVKLLSADFDTSAIGAFKTIRDSQIVNISKK